MNHSRQKKKEKRYFWKFILIFLLAVLFEMNTIVWIADKLFNVAMIAVVVIFQPEMRKALENLGRKNILVNLFNFDFMRFFCQLCQNF